MEPTGTRSLEGWHGQTLALSLGEGDLELVDSVLCLVPELRAVVRFGQEARRRGLTYPVGSAKQLLAVLRKESFRLGEQRVDAASIVHALAKEWFPLAHEGEFLSVVHLAIRRCLAENAAAHLDRVRSDAPKTKNGSPRQPATRRTR
jgi:hypothetical protein